MPYKLDILSHVKSIAACLPQFGATASMNLETLGLEISARNRYYQFRPQFIVRKGDRTQYSPHPSSDATGFIGWLPYFNKRWGFATDKLDFKGFCASNGLTTPAYWQSAQGGLHDVLIKHRKSSFGVGIRGPYRTIDPAQPAHCLEEGEYYENFVPGRIAKVWYWNAKAVALEVHAMPRTSGNGKATLRELVEPELQGLPQSPDRRVLQDVAAYQDLTLNSVISKGQQVLIDFKYGSPLTLTKGGHRNIIEQYEGTKIGQQLAANGRVFWQAVPEAIRENTLFTVDAIIDDEERVWLLEANCNPTGHPDIYPAVLESLFGSPAAVTSSAPNVHALLEPARSVAAPSGVAINAG
jgi:hypothetical protein